MLELKNVSFTVPGEGKKILRDVNLTVKDEVLLVITGPNGGGKTTLAKIIAGIEKPTDGKVYWNGTDVTDMSVTDRAKLGIGYAFQQPVRFKGMAVRDLMALASGRDVSERGMCEYLSMVGLCAMDYIERDVDASLSGGEIKRIEIATVLARGVSLSVFDEPEAGIDLWSFNSLIDVFKRLRGKRGNSLVVISHQERILEIADEIAVIADGTITAYGAREAMLPGLLGGGDDCVLCPVLKEA